MFCLLESYVLFPRPRRYYSFDPVHSFHDSVHRVHSLHTFMRPHESVVMLGDLFSSVLYPKGGKVQELWSSWWMWLLESFTS